MGKYRKMIDIPGLGHGAPIPNGVKIGNLVFSSGISGKNPNSGKLPDDPVEQAHFLFQNIRTFMKNAGGTTDEIAHFKVYLSDEKYRGHINKEWLEMFPDEDDRPARHALGQNLRGGMLFQVELIAVLVS